MKKLLFITIIFFSTNLYAEYIAEGKFRAQTCGWFGFKCKMQYIDVAFNGDAPYTINRVFKNVDEYRDGKCWINYKSKDWGILSDAVNLFNDGFGIKQSDGSYKKVNPEYIIFNCKKKN